jgi:hypothetical protein
MHLRKKYRMDIATGKYAFTTWRPRYDIKYLRGKMTHAGRRTLCSLLRSFGLEHLVEQVPPLPKKDPGRPKKK